MKAASLAPLLSLPLEVALEMTPSLLQDPETSLNTANALLERIRQYADEATGSKKILRSLAEHALPHPFITEQLLELLSSFPLDIIDVLSEVS
jgi:hypothetical protein